MELVQWLVDQSELVPGRMAAACVWQVVMELGILLSGEVAPSLPFHSTQVLAAMLEHYLCAAACSRLQCLLPVSAVRVSAQHMSR